MKYAILTISDTRNFDTDKGGQTIKRIMDEHLGYNLYDYKIVKDDKEEIEHQINEWKDIEEIQFIITTGGTGISPRDTTFDVVNQLLTKEVRGYGELFRQLSYEEVGTRAMLTRATAGLIDKTFIAMLPGSVNAVEVGMNKILIHELPHIVAELNKHKA